MAQQFPELTEGLTRFIEEQHIFFTGTAAPEGTVNVSPKGTDSFRVLSPGRVAWQSLTGSGNETAAHLLKSNRVTVMFCAFTRKPLILRLYGKASAIHPRDADWQEMEALFPKHTGTRQFFVMDIELVQTSCGYAVPFMDYAGERGGLDAWTENKGKEGIEAYWKEHNQLSIDGFETDILAE